MKKISKLLFLTIISLGLIVSSKAMAVSSSCSYVHKQTCCGNGTKTLASGSVTINHNISMQGGTRTNFNVGDVIRFNYSWNGSFTANGGAWDTPTVYKCSTTNSCFNQFVGNTRANTYTQRITDSTGKIGYIQWQADKSSNTGIRLTSSDPGVVACAGTTCSVVGPGTATITATTSRVWVRLFSKIFSDASPNGWYASLAPEGFIDVPGRGYVLGNSTVSDGNSSTDDCVIRNLKGSYIDPPTSSTGNYKGIRIPFRKQRFNITVATPKTKPTAVIDNPSEISSSYGEGDPVFFQGHGVVGTGGGTIDKQTWIEVRPGTNSYNGTACAYVDSIDTNGDGKYDSNDELSSETSFNKNDFSVGTHRVCFNVRQRYDDGTYSWAGQNVEYRDITIYPKPSVDLKINGSDGPIESPVGGNLNITWPAVSNATSCSSTGAGWDSSNKSILGGNDNVAASTTSTYTLQCTGPGGSASDSVQVNICTPNYTYTCISSDAINCTDSANCGKTNNKTNSCLVSDTTSCVAPESKPASVCESNGVTCPATEVEYCPACPNEGNWIEVAP